MSEDILERAKRVEYPDSALRILPGLIAEVERLRSERDYWRQLFQNIQGDRDLLIERDARIKELEAHEQQTHEILGKILGNDDSLETVARRAITKIERLEAAFLKAESQRLWDLGKSTGETSYDCQEAREALERIKEGGKDDY